MASKKVSIVVPVLNSHEVLRRQFLHMERMDLHDVEIIIVDDGSEPPLEYVGDLPVRIIRTNDTRPWTWALARNRGAREALGEYLFMFDIDHYFLYDTIEVIRRCDKEKIQFTREFGVLLEDGTPTQDRDILEKYGLPKNRGIAFGPLPNNFVMRRDTFWDIGGYREDLVEKPYPQGEDRLFKKAWYEYERQGKGSVYHERTNMYMFPNGYYLGDVDADPKHLFHTLTRKTKRNHKYKDKK